MASMASTSSTSARRPRRRDVLCCWLCGMTGPGCVPDVHYAPRSLCAPCRRTGPVAGHRQSRSASALTVLLGLGPAWRMGWRRVLVHRVAARYGVLAWDDTPPTVGPPGAPLEWIAPETRAAARAALAELDAAGRCGEGHDAGGCGR